MSRRFGGVRRARGVARPSEDEGGVAPVPTGVVTAISPAPRREGRWELAVDGRVVGLVSVDVVDRLGLRVGMAIGEAESVALADALAGLEAYDHALRMLAVRGRSAWDLRRRLVERGVTAVHADAAVARLSEAGLLDDAAYARQVARSRVNGRGESRRGVGRALAQARVPRAVADAAVAEVFTEEGIDETALVEAAARKRLRSLAGLDAATRRRRLYGFLARRGYDSAAIREVLGRVLGGDSAAEDFAGAADDLADAS